MTKTKTTIATAKSSEAPCKLALSEMRSATAATDAESIARVVTALEPCLEALFQLRTDANATRLAAETRAIRRKLGDTVSYRGSVSDASKFASVGNVATGGRAR